MGITAIVRRFRAEIREPTDAFTPRKSLHRRSQSGGSLHPDAVLTVDGDEFCAPELPGDISRTLAVVGFASLADPQLSVREVATKAFAVYLSRSSHRETVKAFGEVIGRLRGGGKPSSSELLGAFEAEGLLSLCAVLVKVLMLVLTSMTIMVTVCGYFSPVGISSPPVPPPQPLPLPPPLLLLLLAPGKAQ